jgi:hypothetical protein
MNLHFCLDHLLPYKMEGEESGKNGQLVLYYDFCFVYE